MHRHAQAWPAVAPTKAWNPATPSPPPPPTPLPASASQYQLCLVRAYECATWGCYQVADRPTTQGRVTGARFSRDPPGARAMQGTILKPAHPGTYGTPERARMTAPPPSRARSRRRKAQSAEKPPSSSALFRAHLRASPEVRVGSCSRVIAAAVQLGAKEGVDHVQWGSSSSRPAPRLLPGGARKM